MISQKALKALEYDKIMKDVASFAVLENTKIQYSITHRAMLIADQNARSDR